MISPPFSAAPNTIRGSTQPSAGVEPELRSVQLDYRNARCSLKGFPINQRSRAPNVFAISAIITGVLFVAVLVAAGMNLDTLGPITLLAFGLGFWVTVGTGIWYWRSKPKNNPVQGVVVQQSLAPVLCSSCGKYSVPEAKFCSICGQPFECAVAATQIDIKNAPSTMPEKAQRARPNAVASLISLAIFVATLWYFFGGGVENKVADDVVKQYEIAKRNGTSMDVCVHAGLVAAAYLQAKNEDKYREWKATENADCAAAGLPSER